MIAPRSASITLLDFGALTAALHRGGDIGRKLHDLAELAAGIRDRVVGRLQPDRFAALADTLEVTGLIFAAAQTVPEIAIFAAVAHRRRHEHAVMLALDLGERVADGLQEVFVGDDDRTVEIELDHSLRRMDRVDLAFVVGAADRLRGDVGRKHHDLERLAVAAEQRVVGRPNPDRIAALGDALVFGRLKLAAPETAPEFAIFRAVPGGGIDEHAVMLARDFAELVAERAQEVLVGGDDRPVQIEFDDGLRLAQRVQLGMQFPRRSEHPQQPPPVNPSWLYWNKINQTLRKRYLAAFFDKPGARPKMHRNAGRKPAKCRSACRKRRSSSLAPPAPGRP